jgi:hypothetical protein
MGFLVLLEFLIHGITGRLDTGVSLFFLFAIETRMVTWLFFFSWYSAFIYAPDHSF